MRVLALQPYDAASHRAFLEGWRHHSRHELEPLTLPGRHFKWRMRQAPIEFARQVESRIQRGERFDALWCTAMLDLAAFRGLCPWISALPACVYFHENQLAYPTRHTDPRDLHFGMTNMTSALAAIASRADRETPCVWWNSAYNRDSFLSALAGLLPRMPDDPPTWAVDQIRRASAVLYPGIDPIGSVPRDRSAAPVLLWAARWEYDKGPERFFLAMDELARRGVDFRLSVIGERFADCPGCFDTARDRFAGRIVRWGFQMSRVQYINALREADFIVSTADHEFFGLSIAEAVSAGCVPILPDALAYPELWGDTAIYHDQTPGGVADAIQRALSERDREPNTAPAERFAWPEAAARLDAALEAVASAG